VGAGIDAAVAELDAQARQADGFEPADDERFHGEGEFTPLPVGSLHGYQEDERDSWLEWATPAVEDFFVRHIPLRLLGSSPGAFFVVVSCAFAPMLSACGDGGSDDAGESGGAATDAGSGGAGSAGSGGAAPTGGSGQTGGA